MLENVAGCIFRVRNGLQYVLEGLICGSILIIIT